MFLFILESFIKLIFQLFMQLIGIFLIPIFLFRQEEFQPEHECSRILPDGSKNKRFKDKWFDNIFGNSEDGNCGDSSYFNKYSKLGYWTELNWCAFRNPIHNLALKMGVDDYIVGYKWKGNRYTEDRIGREGFVYSIATGSSGKKYEMIRWCKLFIL
jgi:hypothetical protein